MINPAIVEVKPRPLAVVRVTMRLSEWPSRFREPLDRVYEAVRAGRVAQNGHNVMVYRPRKDGLVDIECGIETAARFELAGDVVYSETPAGRAVTAVHIGPYQRLGSTHDAIAEWIRSNGYKHSGICWEIYGDWNDDPAQLETQIFHLLS